MKELTHKQLNAFILEYNDTLKLRILKGYSNLKRNQKQQLIIKQLKRLKNNDLNKTWGKFFK